MFRLNIWIQSDARHALRNLSRHYGKTKSDVIKDLLIETQSKILDKIYGDDAAWDRYWGIDECTNKNEEKGGAEDVTV